MATSMPARSSMWNQQGNNPQGCALEEALTDVVFNAATSRSAQKKLRYQHALDHGKGDTHSTTDMALAPLPFPPRIAPWLTASMLVPHGSHDLPMVSSMHNKPS